MKTISSQVCYEFLEKVEYQAKLATKVEVINKTTAIEERPPLIKKAWEDVKCKFEDKMMKVMKWCT